MRIDRRSGLPILHAPDKLREFVVHRIEFMRDGQVFGPAVAVFQGDAFRVADAVDFDCADFALDFTWQRGIGNLRIGDDRFFVAVVQDHAALAVGACRQPVIVLEERLRCAGQVDDWCDAVDAEVHAGAVAEFRLKGIFDDALFVIVVARQVLVVMEEKAADRSANALPEKEIRKNSRRSRHSERRGIQDPCRRHR